MKRTKLSDRVLPTYTKGEEIFNMVTHIVGGVIGIAVTALCVVKASLNHNVWGIVTGAIYGFTMILLYVISSIYHGLKPGSTAKKVFQVIDHCSIFILIAGSYTPIVLCSIRNIDVTSGWILFGIIWASAILGIVLNAIDLKKYKILSMISYLLMGWAIIFRFDLLLKSMNTNGIILLLTGGIVYTIGAIFYGLGKNKKYFHSIFHLFILLGSILQFFSILFYVM